MTCDADKLERLISRELDGELTSTERTELEQWLRSDADARATYDATRDLDRQLGLALRAAVDRPPPVLRMPIVTPVSRRRDGWARLALVAVAASLATFAWLQPPQKAGPTPGGAPVAAQGRMLPGATRGGDLVEPIVPPTYERPELQLRGTQRDWIVIPGQRPGTVVIIEVNRVRTHAIGVHQNY